MRPSPVVAVLLSALALAAAAPAAGPAPLPTWSLTLRVTRWVAPSEYLATITAQQRGPRIRIGHAVTLRLDRRTRCGKPVFPCRNVKALVARSTDGLVAGVTGWFETNTHGGPIAFRARTLVPAATP